jgi:hypothetical protein
MRPSWPRTSSSLPPHSPHSLARSSPSAAPATTYAGSLANSVIKDEGRDFEARIVNVCRARIIATYMTRRSSAFSNASASCETRLSSGSSTVSEGKPVRPGRERVARQANIPSGTHLAARTLGRYVGVSGQTRRRTSKGRMMKEPASRHSRRR